MRIELESVRRRFGSVVALDGIDLCLASGSRTALVGPNGSGKSTLIRIVCGLIGHEGRVAIDGLDPLTDRAKLAPRVAYVPQVAPRLSATVGELTAAVCRLRRSPQEPILDAARGIGLDPVALRGKPLRSLSGGTRQKLLAAFALGSGAELLVLDEPTASMDAMSRTRFFDLVQLLDPRPTLLLCSHRLDEIRNLVDRVVALEEGKVDHDGPATQYFAATGRSVVELRTHNGRASTFLLEHGFQQSGTGWWRTTIGTASRGELVREVSDRLGTELEDIVVRDVEESRSGPETRR